MLERDSIIAAQMSAPLSSLALQDVPTGHFLPSSVLPYSDEWQPGEFGDGPLKVHEVHELAVPRQRANTSNVCGHLHAGQGGFTMNESRRASSATVSSFPLRSPQEYQYLSSKGDQQHAESSWRGFLGGFQQLQQPTKYYPDCFVDPNPLQSFGQYSPVPQQLQLLPIASARSQPVLSELSVPHTVQQSVSSPVNSTLDFLPYKRRRVSSVSMVPRASGSRSRAPSTLRLPLSDQSGGTQDEHNDQVVAGRRLPCRRLASPVTSIRPAEGQAENVPIIDEESSGEEEEIADSEGISQQGSQSIPVVWDAFEVMATSANVSSQGSSSSKIAGRTADQVPSVLQGVESIEATASAGGVIPGNGDDDAQPRKQKLRFAEDAYTPLWVKGAATQKEGLCDMCPAPGRWLQLKNSAFW